MKNNLFLSVFIIFIGALLLTNDAAAQSNLVRNPSFEGQGATASDWFPWHREFNTAADCATNAIYHRPIWTVEKAGGAGGELWFDSASSQRIGSQFATWHGGLVQDVAVVPNTSYTFAVRARGRSSDQPYPAPSDTSVLLNVRVGIDPTGGGLWSSPTVIWSPSFNPHFGWERIWVQTIARSENISLFVAADTAGAGNCRNHLEVWFDSASLVADEAVQPPTAVPTQPAVPATATPIPTNTLPPTNTPQPTNTPFPTPTPLPTGKWYTDTPTPVPTGKWFTDTPTPTPLPTNTPIPTNTVPPTEIIESEIESEIETETPEATETPESTATETPELTETPTETLEPTETPTETPTPVLPTPVAVTQEPTETPLPPTPTPTLAATATEAVQAATEEATEVVAAVPTARPTNTPIPGPTADPRNTATICTNTFSDQNANGLREENEGYMAGIALKVGDANGTLRGKGISTGTAQAICFDGLEPGTYEIGQELPDSLEMTTAGKMSLAVEIGQIVSVEFGSRFRPTPTSTPLPTPTEVPTIAPTTIPPTPLPELGFFADPDNMRTIAGTAALGGAALILSGIFFILFKRKKEDETAAG